MTSPQAANIQNTVVEYENLDLDPAYVEFVQGMVSPGGVLHISFFNDRIKGLDRLSGKAVTRAVQQDVVDVSTAMPDPFGLDGNEIKITRRVEANLILNADAVERLIPWLQAKLNEMRAQEERKRTQK